MSKNNDYKKIQEIFKEELDPLKADVKTIKKDMSKVRKDVDVMLTLFDRDYLELGKSIERIEEHLKLSPITS